MESEILDGNYSVNNAGLSDEAKGYLAETAKWAKFLSIVGFISIGLLVLIAFFVGSFFRMMADMQGGNPALDAMPTTFLTIFYLALAGIMFIPVLYHYRFSVKTQQALRANDEPLLTEAFSNLKSYYKFYGIFTAIVLGFYVLIFVFAGIGMMAM